MLKNCIKLTHSLKKPLVYETIGHTLTFWCFRPLFISSVQIFLLWTSRIVHEWSLWSSVNHAFTPHMNFWEVEHFKLSKLKAIHLLCSFISPMMGFLQNKEWVLRVWLKVNQPTLNCSCLESTQWGKFFLCEHSYLTLKSILKLDK